MHSGMVRTFSTSSLERIRVMGAREDRGQRTEDGRWNEEDTSVLCRLSSVVCRLKRLEQPSAFATAHLFQSKTPDRRGRGLSGFCRMSSQHADFDANCAGSHAWTNARRSFLDDYLLKRALKACLPTCASACLLYTWPCNGLRSQEFRVLPVPVVLAGTEGTVLTGKWT